MMDAHDSAGNFRALMEAMARPGKEQMLAPPKQVPSGLSAGMAACLLVLCDQDVGVHLAGKHDQPEIRDWILFHCGSRLVQASDADFVFGYFDDLHPFDALPKGDPQYPDRSTTLIIEQKVVGNFMKSKARASKILGLFLCQGQTSLFTTGNYFRLVMIFCSPKVMP